MNHNPGKGGPLVVVDGTPLSGVRTLAEALRVDLGLSCDYGAIGSEAATFDLLKCIARTADRGPMIAPRLLITPAIRMNEANTRWGSEPCLTPEEWSILDSMIARRNGRLICLVDTPVSIEARAQGMGRGYTRERLGNQLRTVNQALQCSTVARKGSYVLPQFISPDTGEKTEMYGRLVGTIRAEIEAANAAGVDHE